MLVLRQAHELLSGAAGCNDALLEEELAEPGLVPAVKGRILEALEGLLGLGVLFVGPRGDGGGECVPI